MERSARRVIAAFATLLSLGMASCANEQFVQDTPPSIDNEGAALSGSKGQYDVRGYVTFHDPNDATNEIHVSCASAAFDQSFPVNGNANNNGQRNASYQYSFMTAFRGAAVLSVSVKNANGESIAKTHNVTFR